MAPQIKPNWIHTNSGLDPLTVIAAFMKNVFPWAVAVSPPMLGLTTVEISVSCKSRACMSIVLSVLPMLFVLVVDNYF